MEAAGLPTIRHESERTRITRLRTVIREEPLGPDAERRGAPRAGDARAAARCGLGGAAGRGAAVPRVGDAGRCRPGRNEQAAGRRRAGRAGGGAGPGGSRDGGRFPAPCEVTAYYVAAEAFTNAAKHANASAVDILLEQTDGTLRVQVRDGGAGGADPSRGSGLTGLRDRVEAVGGNMTVDSPAGAGTVLTVLLPVPDH
jgi:hypothetical protein